MAFCTEFEKQEEKREIERSHLADFPLAAEANSEQHEEVDDSGAERDFKQRVRVCRQHCYRRYKCYCGVAVIGTGAFLGVLR
jgi:hypothetical protein